MTGKKWVRFGMLLMAAVLYGLAVFFCHSSKEDAGLTYLVLSQNIDSSRAASIFEQEKELADPVGFCFWGEKEGQQVACLETGSYAQVTQVLLSGNPGLMGTGELAWQQGCYIDTETAQTLFGTAACGGQTLWKGGASYRVLGTISAFQPTMLTVAAAQDGSILNRCVLSVPAEQGDTLGQQFLMRWGLQGTVLDFYPVWIFVHNLLLLLPCIFLLFTFMKEIKKLSFSNGFSLFRISALVLVLCLLCCLGSRILIPQDMIPSQWSDFSFWGSWWEKQKENFSQILLTPMGERHLQMMLNMVKSILSSTAALLLSLWTFRRQTNADTAD